MENNYLQKKDFYLLDTAKCVQLLTIIIVSWVKSLKKIIVFFKGKSEFIYFILNKISSKKLQIVIIL